MYVVMYVCMYHVCIHVYALSVCTHCMYVCIMCIYIYTYICSPPFPAIHREWSCKGVKEGRMTFQFLPSIKSSNLQPIAALAQTQQNQDEVLAGNTEDRLQSLFSAVTIAITTILLANLLVGKDCV